MSALPKAPVSTPAPWESVPPLETGDHLTREEFERRYDAMPGLKNAELIEGVVHMPSPVRWKHHGSPSIGLTTWLGTYQAATPGVDAGANASIRLDLENMPQPDNAMIVLPEYGGQAIISEDDYVENAPELVAEISASTVSIDLHEKFRVYRRNKVREYMVWRVQDAEIDWFILRSTQYDRLVPDAAGVLRSEVFPGLWLDAPAMTRCDLAKVLQLLQQGLASPEHTAFVQRLQQAHKP